MASFAHTHTIKITDPSGRTTKIRVDATTWGPVENAPLFTADEAAHNRPADWEIIDGELMFQGQPASLYQVGSTVQLVEHPE